MTENTSNQFRTERSPDRSGGQDEYTYTNSGRRILKAEEPGLRVSQSYIDYF